MKTTIFKLLISFVFLFSCSLTTYAKDSTFVSLSPALTEVFYALGAENQLLAVSTECDYPNEVKDKDIVGNTFFLNKEKLIKISPDYVVMVEGAQYQLMKNDKHINAISYSMNSVNSVYEAILSIGKLTGKYNNAENLVKSISREIENTKPIEQKRVLYLIQLNPIITIGNKSFISDIIRKSGQINLTDDLADFYPTVSKEYILSLKPDVIVVSFKSDNDYLSKLFPNTKIIYLTKEENNLLNRPSSRINMSVKYFSEI